MLVLMILQILVLFGVFRWMGDYLSYFYGGMTALTLGVVVYILNNRDNPYYKLAWIIPILVIPVFGALFYLFISLELGLGVAKKRMKVVLEQTKPYLTQKESVMEKLKQEDEGVHNLANYIGTTGGYPVYRNTRTKFFPLGEDKYGELLRQLELAEEFIFMEYFIIEKGEMWDSILEILKRKAKAGVEVRLMYDGMCMLVLLPHNYPKELEASGIHCKMYAPIRPVLSSYQNNRDHRKITVIDGRVAFTGGVNLADEYINKKKRFGHWKDTAIMVDGDAVQSFTVMFLQMWNITEHRSEDYGRYMRTAPKLPSDGYVIPYGDCPWDHEPVGEWVYMDMLNTAKHYVHIMTPYLILDHEMIVALTFAAKRGVDVRIIMPHIPDKLYAYLLARSYYEELIEAGVKIFEYTPGFVHAKIFVSDQEKAVVGTINLDYRSLYLHFECAAYLYRNSSILSIEEDYQKTLGQCQPVTLEECRHYPVVRRMAGSVLRFFAPLM